jgi:phosphoglycolate phosphatase-like HAD superfamily hydrolase
MPAKPSAVVFDVEGTLVNCVAPILECWRSTLAEAGHSLTSRQLQPYSGMDGKDMLDHLLPRASPRQKLRLLEAQGERYRRAYLRLAQPFERIESLFITLRSRGVLLGIATTCKRDELACYDEKMAGVLAQADAVACGDDVEKGKPHPDLFEVVLRRMGLVHAASGFAVGDTPYDAIAASKVGLRAVGVLTGGFSSEALRAAGCALVLDRVADLVLHLESQR